MQINRSAVVPFHTFLHQVEAAKPQDYVSHPNSKIQDVEAFEEMRRYILGLYKGVHVKHSYLVGGQTVDCIPVKEQPAARDRGGKIAEPPPESSQSTIPSAAACEAGTIPMARITLEQLANFKTLHDFLSKSPGDEKGAPIPPR